MVYLPTENGEYCHNCKLIIYKNIIVLCITAGVFMCVLWQNWKHSTCYR